MRRRRCPNEGHALDCAEQTMRLAVDAVGEVEGARAAVLAAAPESQGPETARRVSLGQGDRDRAYQLVVLGIESVDFTVLKAEIAHQKVAAELAEIVRSDSDAPRSGERGVRAAKQHSMRLEFAALAENGHRPVAWAGHCLRLTSGRRIGHIHIAADVRHIEGDEPPGLDLARGPKRMMA